MGSQRVRHNWATELNLIRAVEALSFKQRSKTVTSLNRIMWLEHLFKKHLLRVFFDLQCSATCHVLSSYRKKKKTLTIFLLFRSSQFGKKQLVLHLCNASKHGTWCEPMGMSAELRIRRPDWICFSESCFCLLKKEEEECLPCLSYQGTVVEQKRSCLQKQLWEDTFKTVKCYINMMRVHGIGIG